MERYRLPSLKGPYIFIFHANMLLREKHVFHPYETDQGAIADYLSALFEHSNNKAAIKALAALRFSVEAFESSLSVPNQFTEEVLRWTIHGLLTSGLLPDEKTAALKDFLMNSVILSEVADVLNMRLAALDDWEWEADGLPVEQRRHVTGKYHIYIEEDLLQAIFLQFIGIKWSVFFKSAFIEFSQFEDAWKSLRVSSSLQNYPMSKTVYIKLTFIFFRLPSQKTVLKDVNGFLANKINCKVCRESDKPCITLITLCLSFQTRNIKY